MPAVSGDGVPETGRNTSVGELAYVQSDGRFGRASAYQLASPRQLHLRMPARSSGLRDKHYPASHATLAQIIEGRVGLI